MRISQILCITILVAGSLSLWAANQSHDGHTPGMSHETTATSPVEGGQSAFAALIEIVSLLEDDPETVWATVSIDRLREHLQDMDSLMLNTSASKTIINDTTIQFTVRGDAQSLQSIHAMVPAHSTVVQQTRGWKIDSKLIDSGATVTITAADLATINKLNALGFYGFMSLDSHHQAHHYQMAFDQNPAQKQNHSH